MGNKNGTTKNKASAKKELTEVFKLKKYIYIKKFKNLCGNYLIDVWKEEIAIIINNTEYKRKDVLDFYEQFTVYINKNLNLKKFYLFIYL